MQTKYVVGFAYNASLQQVLLIKKARPAWQAGHLNGVGGHIEEGEAPLDAMMREFAEETGVMQRRGMWSHVVTLDCPEALVWVYTTVLNDDQWHEAKATTDEPLARVHVARVMDYRTVPNLRWLVPLGSRDDLAAPLHAAIAEG